MVVRARLKRNALLIAVLALPIVEFAVLAGVRVTTLLGFGLLVACHFTAMLGLIYARNRWRYEITGTITTNRDALYIGERLVLRRKNVLHASVTCDESSVCLRFVSNHWIQHWQTVNVIVDNVTSANKVLSDLRLDQDHAVATYTDFRACSAKNAIYSHVAIFGFLAGAIVSVGTLEWHPFTIVLIAALAVAITRELRSKVTVSVGSDVILVKGFCRRDQTIPIHQIEAIDRYGRDVIIKYNLGITTTLCNFQRPWLDWIFAREMTSIDSFVKRLRTVHSLRRSAIRNEPHPHFLVASEQDALFRDLAVPNEALWRVIEDPRIEAPLRLRAAEGLRDLDYGQREDLQEIADACATPNLAKAFRNIADRES